MGTGTLAWSISSCMTLKKTGTFTEAPGRGIRDNPGQECMGGIQVGSRHSLDSKQQQAPPISVNSRLLVQQWMAVPFEPTNDFLEL